MELQLTVVQSMQLFCERWINIHMGTVVYPVRQLPPSVRSQRNPPTTPRTYRTPLPPIHATSHNMAQLSLRDPMRSARARDINARLMGYTPSELLHYHREKAGYSDIFHLRPMRTDHQEIGCLVRSVRG